MCMQRILKPGIRLSHSQRGAALLAMSSILLVIASITVLTLNNLGRVEQRVSGNAVRLREVHSAASGALEYATSWLTANSQTLTFTDIDSDGESETGDTAAPMVLTRQLLNTDDYTRVVIFTLRTSINPIDDFMPRIIDISATAEALNDSHVSKTVHATAMVASTGFFSPDSARGLGFSSPPLLVENCIGFIAGNPGILPLNGISLGTTRGTSDNTCLPPGQLNLNGGTRHALSPPRSLWDTVFGAEKSEADLLALQLKIPDRVFFIDDNYPYDPSAQPSLGMRWRNDVGSATDPVILYFAADQSTSCTMIDNNTEIYGIVYYADPDCASIGFGGGIIHGTLAKAGNLVRLNGNTQITGSALDYGGSSAGTGNSIETGVSVPQFVVLPGSWRDF